MWYSVIGFVPFLSHSRCTPHYSSKDLSAPTVAMENIAVTNICSDKISTVNLPGPVHLSHASSRPTGGAEEAISVSELPFSFAVPITPPNSPLEQWWPLLSAALFWKQTCTKGFWGACWQAMGWCVLHFLHHDFRLPTCTTPVLKKKETGDFWFFFFFFWKGRKGMDSLTLSVWSDVLEMYYRFTFLHIISFCWMSHEKKTWRNFRWFLFR